MKHSKTYSGLLKATVLFCALGVVATTVSTANAAGGCGYGSHRDYSGMCARNSFPFWGLGMGLGWTRPVAYNSGYNNGYNTGYNGYNTGYSGYNNAYSSGYNTGYSYQPVVYRPAAACRTAGYRHVYRPVVYRHVYRPVVYRSVYRPVVYRSVYRPVVYRHVYRPVVYNAVGYRSVAYRPAQTGTWSVSNCWMNQWGYRTCYQ